MYLFLVPTAITVAIILTTVLLKVYRECAPDLSNARPHWADNALGFTVLVCSLLASLGIGIKIANYLFG